MSKFRWNLNKQFFLTEILVGARNTLLKSLVNLYNITLRELDVVLYVFLEAPVVRTSLRFVLVLCRVVPSSFASLLD